MNEQNSVSQERWIRLSADNSSTGIWLRDGAMAEPEELPVSSQLHSRIDTRCWWYEQSKDYLPPEERPAFFDWDAFSQEGLSIACAIKMELPDWTVVYFDMGAYLRSVKNEDSSRETYEYEVEQAYRVD
ncbi:hypothetical protein [Burkholderia sp. Ac-20365]|uniref:hypothetical protein n=1 Tax=Burkholderia sp. Ac-20365 TaxID=2703897 RepID=UPI00197BCA09|nr:hypothetical protein [Burkholderia sp. Ac-20365]MBN3762008.1 hypothetical protein [Burkholderia sp. Ac-20365]